MTSPARLLALALAVAAAAAPARVLAALPAYDGWLINHGATTGTTYVTDKDEWGVGDGFAVIGAEGEPRVLSMLEPAQGSDEWTPSTNVITPIADPDGGAYSHVAKQFGYQVAVCGDMIVAADDIDYHVAFKVGYRLVRWVGINVFGGLAAQGGTPLCSFDRSADEKHRIALVDSTRTSVQFLVYDKATDSIVDDGAFDFSTATMPTGCESVIWNDLAFHNGLIARSSGNPACRAFVMAKNTGAGTWAFDATRTVQETGEVSFGINFDIRGDYVAVAAKRVTDNYDGKWWLYHYNGASQVAVASSLYKGAFDKLDDTPVENVQVSEDGSVLSFSSSSFGGSGHGGLLVLVKGAVPATVNAGYGAVTFHGKRQYEDRDPENACSLSSTAQPSFGISLHMSDDGSTVLTAIRRACVYVMQTQY